MLTAMPDVVGLGSALVVGVVVVWAGASKLLAGSSWYDGVASAGVPRWILNPLPLSKSSLVLLLLFGYGCR